MNTVDTAAPSVVVVEDNDMLRQELVLFLSEVGMDVRGVDTGDELNQALLERPAHILVLDLNLPGEDGISITRRIRNALPALGIIILSARVRSTDRLEGYATGADVYLTKPTRPEELEAVIRNLFGRIGTPRPAARWRLDMTAQVLVSAENIEITLTRGEALLLQGLALNGQFMNHAALAALFGDTDHSEKINKARVEVLISRLRTKLSPHMAGGLDIKVVRGRGYQLGFLLAVDGRNPRRS
ncbi:MAG: two component transcriptional regulator, winged helix family [Herminiimonas sp.]|nr:two component transcriptional regulator, winged helix family [Herminiimonas sp.]